MIRPGVSSLLLLYALSACRPGPPPAAAPPSILLVTLDTTRADRLGCYGYAPARTPHLDALAREGLCFDAAFTCAPLTLPAHASLFTGRFPPDHGLRVNGGGRLHPDLPLWPETLREKGYRTAAFIAAAVLDPRHGLDRGFDLYDLGSLADPEQNTAERTAAEVTAAALAWLAHQPPDAPVLLWVHYFEPHSPYQGILTDTPTLTVSNAYDGEIAAMDAAFGTLRAAVSRSAWGSNLLIVAVGDHGESLGEHHEWSHGFTLYDGAVRIPLILRLPDGAHAGTRRAEPVSLVGLRDFILEGVDRRFEPDLLRRTPIYLETLSPQTSLGWSPLFGLVEGPWKYIRTRRPELYHRLDDPAETRDRIVAHPDRVAAMDRRLADLRAGTRPLPPRPASLNPADIRRLESLGYAAAPRPPPPDEFAGPDVKDELPAWTPPWADDPVRN